MIIHHGFSYIHTRMQTNAPVDLFSTVNLLEKLILTKQEKKEEDFHREGERERTYIEHAVHARIFHFQTIISGGYMGADLFERNAYVCEQRAKKREEKSDVDDDGSSWRIRRRRGEKKGEERREKSYFAAPLRVFI